MFNFQDLLINTDILTETSALYAQMDAAYARIADAHGFHCSGCVENCCLTLFFHHTLVEYLYMMKGFYDLAPAARDQITRRAARVNAETDRLVAAGESCRVMCPLNMNGLCVLYEYRPMICRLHGIIHEFCHPSGRMVSGPGCTAFESRRDRACGQVLDRTSLYRGMAVLETRGREKTGVRDRFKMTVAQMLAAAGENPT